MAKSQKIIIVLSSSVLLLGIGLFAFNYFLNLGDVRSMDSIRIAFPLKKSVSTFDPAKIHLAPEYIFCENIFSPLIEFTPTGEIVGGLAESFIWKGNELHLNLRKNQLTASGLPITAEDAAFSLKRLLVLASATHGDLLDLLCDGQPLRLISDPCPGIDYLDNTVILKVNGPKTFLIPLLASIDFAVIPKSSVDAVSLKIIDYRNTSGVYFVESEDGVGNIVLVANKNHYHYTKNIPQKIYLVPTSTGQESIESLLSSRVDMLTTVDHAAPDQMIAAAKNNSSLNLHVTMNIRSLVATFTDRGLKDFSEIDRLVISKKIRKSLINLVQLKDSYEATLQIFPVFGEAGLTKEQTQRLAETFKDQGDQEGNKGSIKFRIVRLQPREEFERSLRTAFPNAEVDYGTVPNFDKFANLTDKPHISINGPDMGYLEDFSLLSYGMAAGTFGLTEQESQAWLKKYQAVDKKEIRIEMLRDLHFDTIKHMRTIPIAVFPYTAIIRKPWKLGLSNIFANNQLWLIQAN